MVHACDRCAYPSRCGIEQLKYVKQKCKRSPLLVQAFLLSRDREESLLGDDIHELSSVHVNLSRETIRKAATLVSRLLYLSEILHQLTQSVRDFNPCLIDRVLAQRTKIQD
jgi:hypothetical protein